MSWGRFHKVEVLVSIQMVLDLFCNGFSLDSGTLSVSFELRPDQYRLTPKVVRIENKLQTFLLGVHFITTFELVIQRNNFFCLSWQVNLLSILVMPCKIALNKI